MPKVRVAVTVASLGLFSMSAAAQNAAVIKQRQEIYKSFNTATKPVGLMLRGSSEFDLKVVQEALKKYSEGSKKLPALFPDDAKTGGDTEALPAIWEHKADFEARLKKFGDDADAAMTTIKDQPSFAANFPDIAKQCGGCHKLYREKKDKE